jgi:hypothetical protein
MTLFSALGFLGGTAVASGDIRLIRDVSDTTLGAPGTEKQVYAGEDAMATQRLAWQTWNVKAHGALGDGSTDDTTAIQAAMDAANTAGGGMVYFPPGTYITTAITIYSQIKIVGAGPELSVVKMKASTNTQVFTSTGFSGLTGGNTGGGIAGFEIRDLAVDGNKANNTTAGVGIRIYGYDFRIDNVNVRNCKGTGIYCEWGSGTSAVTPDNFESSFIGIKSHDNGGDGFDLRGPHDSMLVNCIAYLNAGNGFSCKGNGGAMVFSNCHSWGYAQVWAYYLETGGNLLSNCTGEGAGSNSTTGGQVFIGANDNSVTGGNFFSANAGTPTRNVRGIVIGDGSHTSLAGTHIDTKVTSCESGAVDFAQDAGSRVVVCVYQNAGTVYVGTPASTTEYQFSQTGGAGTGAAHSIRGELRFTTLGAGLSVKTGSNARMGTGTLVSGQCQVFTGAITNNSYVFITRVTPGGTLGAELAVKNPGGTDRSAGNWFFVSAINSAGTTVTTDTSTFYWFIVESI